MKISVKPVVAGKKPFGMKKATFATMSNMSQAVQGSTIMSIGSMALSGVGLVAGAVEAAVVTKNQKDLEDQHEELLDTVDQLSDTIDAMNKTISDQQKIIDAHQKSIDTCVTVTGQMQDCTAQLTSFVKQESDKNAERFKTMHSNIAQMAQNMNKLSDNFNDLAYETDEMKELLSGHDVDITNLINGFNVSVDYHNASQQIPDDVKVRKTYYNKGGKRNKKKNK